MKYLQQFLRIVFISFLGELCRSLIPAPIPASIYGLILLFLALKIGFIKPEQIRETSQFLVGIMAVLFVCPAVGLLNYWELLKDSWLAILVIVIASLLLTFAVSGWVTQRLLKKEED